MRYKILSKKLLRQHQFDLDQWYRICLAHSFWEDTCVNMWKSDESDFVPILSYLTSEMITVENNWLATPYRKPSRRRLHSEMTYQEQFFRCLELNEAT